MTETFMTDNEYGIAKGYDNFADFFTRESYPPATTLNQFREDIWGWMVGYIGNNQARSNYDTEVQYKLRNIEYRAVELMVSGEIAKNKIENYIANAIIELFGETDKAETDVADDTINRGVTEG